jgi:sugar-specific transcriptional regulator TrmB
MGFGLKQEKIEKSLRDFGLSKKEAEVYIFLAKYGAITSGQITKQLKLNRGQVYRILKRLQKKNLLEATLEYPTRYAAVSFETVIDSLIKSKKEEVARIEESKKDLISDWEKIKQIELENSFEKFSVIEGTKKIQYKLSQMVQKTNRNISMALNISDVFRAEQFGVFDFLYNPPKKSIIDFRVLTQNVQQNVKPIKILKEKLKTAFDFRGLDSTLGSFNFSRMVIRDNDEVVLFISDKNKQQESRGKEVCLSTNCTSIIEAFSGIFENLWKNSTNIEDIIAEFESAKHPTRTQIINDPLTAKERYAQAIKSAKQEILLVTSSNGLFRLSKNRKQLEDWLDRGLSIKIMAPIVNENLEITQKLLKYGEVKHIPLGYFETTIIDKKQLFRFEYPPNIQGKTKGKLNFQNLFYTNDLDYIKKTTELLYDIWKKTRKVSPQSARSIIEPKKPLTGVPYPTRSPSINNTKLVINKEYFPEGKLSEKDVLDKIEIEKIASNNHRNVNWYETIRLFGSRAFAVIRPPEYFNMPDMVIGVLHNTKESSFGAGNSIIFMSLLETPKGFSYVPVTIIQDQNNSQSIASKKANLQGTPAAQNIIVLKENQLQIQINEKTLFAGWTKPIPLGSLNTTLPPCCILFEGYSEVKPGVFTSYFPSGRKHEVGYLTCDAFVSFYHPQEKYIGSGTEGIFDLSAYQIMYPVEPKDMERNQF